MAGNGAPRDSTRFVAMFQKAHSHLAALQRVDEQISALLDQRRKAIEELRAVQGLINSEFARVLDLSRVLPSEVAAAREADDLLADAPSVSIGLKPAPPRELKVSAQSAVRPGLQASAS